MMRENKFYQMFLFAMEEHAEIFRAEFSGERMHPSMKGKETRWARWNEGSCNAR
jgi:hypothetical protein